MNKLNLKVICIIPARYNSTRLQGKPLLKFGENTMIELVYSRAKKLSFVDELVVATDDIRIFNHCEEKSIRVIMTNINHKNGSERAAEVARSINGDIYIILQGDEPIFSLDSVEYLFENFLYNNWQASVIKTRFRSVVDVVNTTTPKIVTSIDGRVLYISRSPIPFPHNSLDFSYFKLAGQYIYSKKAISCFENPRIGMEEVEDIEILRLLEYGVNVYTVEYDTPTIAVDTLKDYERVRGLVMDETNRL